MTAWVEHVLPHLSGDEILLCSLTCRAWRAASQEDDSMWKAVCFRELGLTKPENPPPLHEKAKLCANFREAWRAWRTEYAEFFQSTEQATVIRRAARCWNSIKGWLDEHAPQIAATLAPGVSKEEAAALSQLPDGEGSNSLELRALYRVHNGQRPELVPRTYDTASAGNWDGLLGGYSFYQHIINTRMMTLSEGIRLAQQLPGRDRASRSVVVAHSLILGRDAPEKLYSYSFKDAALSLQQASQPRGSYVPPTTGLLDWFEEYASLLSADTFRIAPVLELPQTTGEPGINLYPITPPRFGEAVTHGVCVRAGSLFIPELSRPSEYWFSYSMRMHIPESSSSAAPPAGCQLLSRHLIFDKGVRGVPPQIVDGEAVIGMHPLLKVLLVPTPSSPPSHLPAPCRRVRACVLPVRLESQNSCTKAVPAHRLQRTGTIHPQSLDRSGSCLGRLRTRLGRHSMSPSH